MKEWRNQILREKVFCPQQLTRQEELLAGNVDMEPADTKYSGQTQICNCHFLIETQIK